MGERATVRAGMHQLRRARENMIKAGRRAGLSMEQIRMALGESRQALAIRVIDETESIKAGDRAREIDQAFAAVGLQRSEGAFEASTMHDVELRFLKAFSDLGIEITHSDIRAKTRKHAIARPRIVLMWLQRLIRRQSFERIAEHYGMTDHTTVIHACGRGKTRALASDEDLMTAARATIAHFHKPFTRSSD